ncbi:ABC transporter ATP-binding protein [Bacillus rubiinfantis]|uniref:ABC transporter ATP-binding protein n=1 Tax=Bacillus rubiinfantis TaxID=1499680 RepID=UPI0005AA0A60|nr:ABC transporter ATP-binding protein [Bacillus rubiinfantis]
MGILKIDELRKTFSSGEVEEEVLKGINLALKEGEITALVGTSGSGKSTLLTIAAGLQSATDGQVLFDGRNLTGMSQEQIRQIRASKFGFIFQFAYLVPFLTVEEQLRLMLDVADKRMKKTEQQQEINQLLSFVGMEHRKKAYPTSLSGGEKQRVAIARALIHKPKILFADEPTASLDSKRSNEVMGLIKQLTEQLHIATLLVTHDEDMLSYADRIVKMSDGTVL